MARCSIVAAFVFAAMLMYGCNTTGTARMTYRPSQDLPPLMTVNTTGNYYLYPEGSDKPIWSDSLGPGDEYGFVKRADGLVYGVAKGQDIPLPSQTTSYVWKQVAPYPPSDE